MTKRKKPSTPSKTSPKKIVSVPNMETDRAYKKTRRRVKRKEIRKEIKDSLGMAEFQNYDFTSLIQGQFEVRQRVIIAGSRDYYNYATLVELMNRVTSRTKVGQVICGMSKGVDQMGFYWALDNEVLVEPHFAQWDKYGRSAGPIRNKEMAKAGDVLVAVLHNKSAGTLNMIKAAEREGLEIFLYDTTDPRRCYYSLPNLHDGAQTRLSYSSDFDYTYTNGLQWGLKMGYKRPIIPEEPLDSIALSKLMQPVNFEFQFMKMIQDNGRANTQWQKREEGD